MQRLCGSPQAICADMMGKSLSTDPDFLISENMDSETLRSKQLQGCRDDRCQMRPYRYGHVEEK